MLFYLHVKMHRLWLRLVPITIFICFSSLISIGICLLVDYILIESFSWSLTASASIAYGCIILSVFLMCPKARLEKAMGISSILLFPILYVISMQVELTIFFPKAYVIALGAVILAWLVYGILFHLYISIWYRLILITTASTIYNVFINIYTETKMQNIIKLVVSNFTGIIILAIIGTICQKKYKNRF